MDELIDVLTTVVFVIEPNKNNARSKKNKTKTQEL